jgi:hypothetical protein
MATCVRCKKDWPEGRMILSAQGHVCPECEMKQGQDQEMFRGVWLTAASGPGFAFSFSLAGLLSSMCLGVLAPAVWLVGGIAVAIMAVRAAMLLWSLRTDYAEVDVGVAGQIALAASSLLAGFWAFWLVLLGAWGLFVAVISS